MCTATSHIIMHVHKYTHNATCIHVHVHAHYTQAHHTRIASFPGLRPDFISQPWRKNLGGCLGTRLTQAYTHIHKASISTQHTCNIYHTQAHTSTPHTQVYHTHTHTTHHTHAHAQTHTQAHCTHKAYHTHTQAHTQSISHPHTSTNTKNTYHTHTQAHTQRIRITPTHKHTDEAYHTHTHTQAHRRSISHSNTTQYVTHKHTHLSRAIDLLLSRDAKRPSAACGGGFGGCRGRDREGGH